MNPTHWQTSDDGWRYYMCPLDIDPVVAGTFASLVAIWQSKRQGDRLPAWRDFGLMDFKDWWGWLSVYDIVGRDPLDLWCRLWGGRLAMSHDQEFTHARLRDPASGMYGDSNMLDGVDVAFMEELIDGPLIGLSDGPMTWRQRDYERCESLRMPLADDGGTVDKLLCATRYL
ncbi:MAG: hypothetical protein RIC16_04565 [Rhodospirillales bacterium]